MTRRKKPERIAESRPRAFKVGELSVRAARKPAGAAWGTWYWTATRYTNGAAEHVWAGAGDRAAVMELVAALVASGDAATTAKERRNRDVATVRDLLEMYLHHLKIRVEVGRIAQLTFKGRKTAAKRVVAKLGNSDIDELDQDLADRFVARRLREGAAPISVHLDLRLLREALAWGRKKKLIDIIEIDIPPLDLSPKRVRYTPDQAEVVELLVHMDPKHWSALAVRMLAGLGGRLGEIAQVRWEEVELWRDADGWKGVVQLHGRGKIGRVERRGKTGSRVVTLPGDLAEVLAARRPADATGSIYGVAPSTVVASLGPRWIARACKAAGLPRWSPGGGRRMVSETLLGDPNVDLVSYKAITGHDPNTALRNYAKGRESRLRPLTEGLRLTTPKEKP